jgi:capsular exopolysaccharide synthesis family protein
VLPKLGTGHRNGLSSPVITRSPRSAASEAYRTLRTNLQFSSLDRDIKTVLITSAGAGEGKTTIVANLGVAAAESGKQVLLVDCDLREPALHKVFDLSPAPGLTGALLEHDSQPPIRSTSVLGLSVVTAGEVPPNPAEFVASERLGRMLDQLREQFDLVIVDSPPAGLAADAAVLSARVDGVVLVVSAGRTRRDLARHAREQLDRVGAHLLGAVLNNAKLEKRVREFHAAAR